MKKIINYWLPPIIWMLLIFILSSRQSISIADKHLVNFLLFKFLHIIEYAILYFLLFRAFNKKKSKRVSYLMPFIISLVFAAIDEIHQTFVPTREGTIRDVLIDAMGIVFMYSYIKNHLNVVRKYL